MYIKKFNSAIKTARKIMEDAGAVDQLTREFASKKLVTIKVTANAGYDKNLLDKNVKSQADPNAVIGIKDSDITINTVNPNQVLRVLNTLGIKASSSDIVNLSAVQTTLNPQSELPTAD